MKKLLVLFLLVAGVAVAQQVSEPEPLVPVAPSATPPPPPPKAPELIVGPNDFPGIKIVMTPEEFAKAGLAGLSDDQLAVINQAIARHYNQTVAKYATEQAEQMTEAAVAQEKQKSWLATVGLPNPFTGDWKDQPSVKGTCTGWATGNAFKLDNGQVWEGIEPIRMELSGHDIEIQTRPNGQFDLVVDGKNTTYRVIRVK